MEVSLEEKIKELEKLQNELKSKYEHAFNSIQELISDKEIKLFLNPLGEN